MDQIACRVLQFDRFALDLMRGCVRVGERDIDLRPKSFDVLRHLVTNAGRLVSKQELHDAVWTDVTVTDDSLVQCIRELRHKLGDDERRLIKTVSRRGYLLDAKLAVPGLLLPEEPGLTKGPEAAVYAETRLDAMRRVFQELRTRRRRISAAVVMLGLAAVAVGLSALHANWVQDKVLFRMLLAIQSHPASELFSRPDAQRVAEIAEKKELPLPAFQIRKPANDVPESMRRFIGVWVSDTGWMISNRQIMMIVTDVDSEGVATGYVINGPPGPRSQVQNPANATPFTGRISGDVLVYGGPLGAHVMTLTVQGRIEYTMTFTNGAVGAATLDSAWNLVDAERVAAATMTER
jgi:DNA-binding winged helix-turn-helix (wHTH) protein